MSLTLFRGSAHKPKFEVSGTFYLKFVHFGLISALKLSLKFQVYSIMAFLGVSYILYVYNICTLVHLCTHAFVCVLYAVY